MPAMGRPIVKKVSQGSNREIIKRIYRTFQMSLLRVGIAVVGGAISQHSIQSCIEKNLFLVPNSLEMNKELMH